MIAIIAAVVAAVTQLWNTNDQFRASVEAAMASDQAVSYTHLARVSTSIISPPSLIGKSYHADKMCIRDRSQGGDER